MGEEGDGEATTETTHQPIEFSELMTLCAMTFFTGLACGSYLESGLTPRSIGAAGVFAVIAVVQTFRIFRPTIAGIPEERLRRGSYWATMVMAGCAAIAIAVDVILS